MLANCGVPLCLSVCWLSHRPVGFAQGQTLRVSGWTAGCPPGSPEQTTREEVTRDGSISSASVCESHETQSTARVFALLVTDKTSIRPVVLFSLC
jgi:hypothetical protein